MVLDESPEAAMVELDIFSGRPNPSWALTEDQLRAVVDRVTSLTTVASGSLAAPLGYRGFIVYLDGGSGARTVVTVQSGVVRIEGPAGVTWARDTDRGLERLLADQGRPSLPADLAEIVDRSLDG